MSATSIVAFCDVHADLRFPSMTWGSSSSKVQIETWWDFRNDMSFSAGHHALKMGVASVSGLVART